MRACGPYTQEEATERAAEMAAHVALTGGGGDFKGGEQAFTDGMAILDKAMWADLSRFWDRLDQWASQCVRVSTKLDLVHMVKMQCGIRSDARASLLVKAGIVWASDTHNEKTVSDLFDNNDVQFSAHFHGAGLAVRTWLASTRTTA